MEDQDIVRVHVIVREGEQTTQEIADALTA
jgi:hypothetical protein